MDDQPVMQIFDEIKDDFALYRIRLRLRNPIKAFIFLVLFSQGFQLVVSIRLQRAIGRMPLVGPVLRRLLWWVTSILTATDISFGANFGARIYFPHPTGIVIGDSWDLGSDITVMQGVTLGRKNSDIDPLERSRVGNGVVIGAGAKLIGELIVGEGAVIGANAVVTNSIPENITAIGVPARHFGKTR